MKNTNTVNNSAGNDDTVPELEMRDQIGSLSISQDNTNTNNNNNTNNNDNSSNVLKGNNDKMTVRSLKILNKMDRTGTGIITYEDAALYGKNLKSETRKWKLLFCILLLLLFIIFGIIFGLFILGFEITKITKINNNGEYKNALISSETGNQITTITGEEEVNINNFWNIDDNDEYNICNNNNKLTSRIRYIHGLFSNKYYFIVISYFTMHDIPYNYLEIYDNSGNIKINYYQNYQDAPNEHQVIMYEKLFNGTIIERYSDYHDELNNIYTDTDDDDRRRRRRRRRMQGDSGEPAGRFFAFDSVCWGVYY